MADPQLQDQQPPPGLSFPTDPSEFDSDDRISFSRLDNKFIAVQDDGTEFEFDNQLKRWIPTLDEELIRQQQSAYGGPDVDDDHEHDHDQSQRHGGQRNNNNNRKRKKDGAGGGATDPQQRPNKRQAGGARGAPAPRQNTAVYVTGLPLDATADEVHEVFSRKCGVVAEEIDSGRPRIKMYADDEGRFKGDALVVFFKPQSVEMAIMLLDDTDFRYTPSGLASGRMRVQAADSSYKKTNYDADGAAAGTGAAEVKDKGGDGASREATNGGAAAKPKDSRAREQEKQKIIKRTQKLDAKLADWDDDDPYGEAPPEAAAAGAAPRRERLVILRHMFTLEELDEDPAALLEIKEDVREECSKLGAVTNVVLYDLEPEGVVAVKFRDPDAADACVRLMDGRAFDGRIVRARVAAGRERFKKSGKKQDDGDGDDDDDDEDRDRSASGSGGGGENGEPQSAAPTATAASAE